jgi:5-methylcytosine-specific restriction endonuclease McrA
MAKSWAQAFYKSKAWRAAREQALRRDAYTCHDCEGRATEVHHIRELTPDNIGDPAIALGLDNLQCLCHACHTKRTLGMGDVEDGYEFDADGQVIQVGAYRR